MLSRKWIWIGLFIGLAVITGWFVFRWVASSNVAARKMKKELERLVEQGSGGLYNLEIGSIKVVPEKLQVHLYELKLVPDQAVYQDQVNNGTAAPDLFSFSADKLTINNITPADFIADKSIMLQSIQLHEVLVEVIHTDSLVNRSKRQKKDTTAFDAEGLYDRIKKDVRKIAVDTVLFSSLNLRYINSEKQRDTTFLKNLNIFAEDFLLNDSSALDSSRFLFTKSLVVQSWQFEAPLKNENYKLKFDTLRMVIAGNTHTTIRNFKLQPLYTEQEYSKRISTQLERFNVSVPTIKLVNFQYDQLLRKGVIVADSLYLRNAFIGVYKDRTKKFDGKTRLGKYPHQLLQHSGLPIDVDVCVLTGSDIVYRERSDKTEETGEVKFTGTYAVVKPIRSVGSGAEPVMVDADTRFMGTTAVKTTFMLYPASSDGDFTVKADFAPLDMKVLNKATIHLGEVRIDSGNVETLKFAIRGNDHFSTTDLHFKYSGLKASMLKQEQDGGYKKRGLLSLVANAFVLKSDNRKREKHVVVRYRRDTDKSMFNLIWKGVFSGMKEIAGAGALGKDKDRVEVLRKD